MAKMAKIWSKVMLFSTDDEEYIVSNFFFFLCFSKGGCGGYIGETHRILLLGRYDFLFL